MKAITLTQPWATLVAIGAKRVETRTWSTRYRGPLAIHAAKGLGQPAMDFVRMCRTEPFKAALGTEGDLLARGMVVATAALVAVIWTEHVEVIVTDDRGADYDRDGPYLRDGVLLIGPREAAFGDYSRGRYAWLLEDVRPLPEPVPARGALGLWEWEGTP